MLGQGWAVPLLPYSAASAGQLLSPRPSFSAWAMSELVERMPAVERLQGPLSFLG